MTRPWQTLAQVATPEGPLELRQRGDRDFLITISGRVLMTSQARRSEEALATLPLRDMKPPRLASVVIGGLGMGYTLRAALDVLPASSRVTVVELNPDVVQWCRGPLAPLTDSAIADPRVTVVVGDVADFIVRSAPGAHDAIVVDLYEGPHHATQHPNDPIYGSAALTHTRTALAPGGVFAVWSEEPDQPFELRLARAGFAVRKQRSGAGGRAHLVYLGYT
jgi:spermidine synthase